MTTNDKAKAGRQHFGHIVRILFVVLLFPVLFFLGMGPVATEGDEMRQTFFMTAIPSIIIVFLIPVIIRGSPGQKIVALILLFPAAGFGFMGWAGIVGGFLSRF